MNIKSFTLSEILITIGIIGIVSALTIPNMITNYKKKQTATELKKVYADLQQVYRLNLAEGNENMNLSTNNSMDIYTYFNTYWQKHLSNAQICTSGKACGYKGSTNIWSYSNGSNFDNWAIKTENSRILFKYRDKVIFQPLKTVNFVVNFFVVDLNAMQGPNIFGKDLFMFEIIDGEGIKFSGYPYSDWIVKTDCKTGNGKYCGEWIRRNDWKIPANYPW